MFLLCWAFTIRNFVTAAAVSENYFSSEKLVNFKIKARNNFYIVSLKYSMMFQVNLKPLLTKMSRSLYVDLFLF